MDRSSNFWERLEAKTDFSRSRPQVNPGYEQAVFTDRRGEEYFVLRSAGGRGYVKLGTKDLFLFSRLDGQRTVQQILAEYFHQFRTLAFSRLGSLVQELLSAGFLTQRPVRFYHLLRSRLQPSCPLWRLLGFVRSLPHRQWPIPDFDRKVARLYRSGFHFLFNLPLFIFIVISSLSGMAAFLSLLKKGGFALFSSGGSVVFGLVVLIVLNYIAIICHELSHALACKHYGRTVNEGGTTLYMGLPAFYVDTTDAWMLPKRKRMVVTAVGGLAQFFLAGLAAGLAWALPQNILAPFLFKFSVLSYLSVFLNLNPFLELDGYYLLIDWLDMPGLKSRAREFVKKSLWRKLRHGEKLSFEERVYTAFGLGGLLWSALALGLVALSWRQRLGTWTAAVWGFISRQGLLIIIALAALFLIGLALALRRRIASGIKIFWQWFLATVNRRPWAAASALLALCLAVSGLLSRVRGWPDLAMALLVLLGAGLLYQRIYAYYRGSHLWLVLMGLVTVMLASLAKKLVGGPLDRYLSLVASVVLFIACYLEFSYSSLRRWSHRQRVAWGLLWLILLGAVGFLPHGSAWGTASALLSLSALLMMLSPLWTNLGSALEYFWYAFLLQTVAWNIILLAGARRFALLSALWGLFAMLWLYLVIKSARWQPEAASFEHIDSERKRMRQAAVRIYKMVRRYFASFHGEAQAKAMDDRLNLSLIANGWPIRLYGRESEERFERSLGIVERSRAFRGMLDELFNYIAAEAGAYFARQAFRVSYESLYWEEREIAQLYLMRDSRWAEGLVVADIQRERSDAQDVMAAVARFWEMGPEESAAFASRLKEERKHAGEIIIRQGDVGDRFYIVKSGRVEISVRDEKGQRMVLAVLAKGDYFGEIALVKNVPRTATALALSECSLMVLEKADFDILIAQRPNVAERIDRLIENRSFLIQLPIFAELAPAQVAMLASRLLPQRYQPGEAVVIQGEVGDSFYIIKEGLLEVAVEKEGTRRKVAELGPGEYFGEIALLLDVPRTASVISQSESLVLRLWKKDFQELLGEQLYFAKSLEQTSSRRLSDTRHKLVAG